MLLWFSVACFGCQSFDEVTPYVCLCVFGIFILTIYNSRFSGLDLGSDCSGPGLCILLTFVINNCGPEPVL